MIGIIVSEEPAVSKFRMPLVAPDFSKTFSPTYQSTQCRQEYPVSLHVGTSNSRAFSYLAIKLVKQNMSQSFS